MAMTDDREPGSVSVTDNAHADATSSAHVVFTALRGGVGVIRDGERVAIGGPQQQRLLAALLAAKGTAVSADRLADTIWPDGAMPDGARRTVMSYVSRLRATIGGDYVVTGANGYQLVLGDAAYDADEFEARLALARASTSDASIDAYDRALELWSGRAFGDDGSEWWLSPVASRLEELRLVAHEERCERLIEAGRHAEAVADLQGLIADQPLREQFIALEMRALYLSGRQAEALRSYRSFAEYLAEETGLDPSEMLTDLEQKILAGDPSLAPTNGIAVPGYELGDLIGEGAFGAVYRAVQPSLGRDVAVKAIRAELADDPKFVQRFETEAQLVARLEHPHVVPLYDFWRQPGAAFLVFRLLRGGSLADRISSGPLSLAEVSKLVEEIGGALAAAHALGIVHRDVKPANVLFDEAGNSYLADFGIADGGGGTVDVALRSAGSPLYASPEQARDGVAGQASDQYSLAVMAWEALVGRAPFEGATATEVLRSKLTHTLPSLGGIADDHGALDAVLQRASAPIPVDRYRDVTEFVHAWATACAVADPTRTTGGLRGEPAAVRAAGTLASLSLGSVNPYKGLRAFREADAAEFQGRSELVSSLVERVATDPFVLVVGPSGSGKSSLVHAGVVPVLRRQDALVVSMVPSTDPFVELEAALRRVATSEVGDIGTRLLERTGLSDIAADLATGDGPLVLVIDQFEELWTLVPSDTVRDRFAACLAAAVSSPRGIRIIATLRADLYDRPLQHPLLGSIVRDSSFAVTPMTSAELHDAIALPAEHAGVRFEPGLVSAMVGDVVSRPGALPLLQFALTELFEQRINGVVTAGAYTELGGIGGAIARRAEQLYGETPHEDRADVRLLFTQLVTPGDDNDDLRRRANRDELAAVDPGVIDRFLAHRLLVTDVNPITREPTLEVAHEALLREWPRLAEWIDEDRDIIRLHRTLETAAHDWHAHGRDDALLFRGSRLVAAQETARLSPLTPSEREFLDASEALDERERTETAERAEHQARQNRRLQRLLVAVAVVLVVALAAGLLAFRQRNRANSESAAARAAQAEAEQASTAAQASSDEATAQRTLAEDSQNEALALALAAQSTTLLANDQNDLAMLLAVESRRFADQTSLAGSADTSAHDSLLQAIGNEPTLVGFLEGQAGLAAAMTFSPDGRRFATVDDAGALRVWDADTRRPAEAQPLTLPYTAGSLAMNDDLLAAPVNGGSPRTWLWDVNEQELWRWQPPGYSAWFPAGPGNRLAVALSDAGLLARSFADLGEPNSFVEIWDTGTGTMVAGPIDVAGAVGSMDFSPDGERLAVAATSPDRLTFDMEILDVRTGASRWRSVAHPSSTNGVFDGELLLAQSWARFSADGTQISGVASHSTAGAIVTLDATTGAPVASNDVGRDRTVLAVSDDLTQLVLAADADEPNNPAEVVDARTGDVLASIPADVDPSQYRPMALRPNSAEVMVQSDSGGVTVHDWTDLGADGFVAAPPAELLGPDLATTTDGEVIDLSEPLRQLGVSGDIYRRWTASPSGQVAIATDATIDIWDPSQNEFVRRLELPPNCEILSGIGLSFFGTGDDGSVIAECMSPVDTLKLTMWDLGSPSPDPYWMREKLGSGMFIHSPDGSRVLDRDFAGLRLVTVAGGSEVARWPGIGRDPMVRAAYSPDGRVVAVLRTSGEVELLRAEDLGLIRRLESSTGSVDDSGLPDGFPAIAVSADNEYVAVWHGKLGVELWNADSGESMAVLDGRRDDGPPAAGDTEASLEIALGGPDPTSARFPSVTLRFDEDGNGLDLSVIQGFQSDDGTRFSRRLDTRWSLDDDEMIDAACGIVQRDLTEAEWATYVGAGVPYRPTCSGA